MISPVDVYKLYNNVIFKTYANKHELSKIMTQAEKIASVLSDMKRLKKISRINFIKQSNVGVTAIGLALKELAETKQIRIEKSLVGNITSHIIHYVGESK